MKPKMTEIIPASKDSVWVFGYGSLTWKPGISYSSKQYGYIKGFKRRFWQGNTTHRGTPEKPGRVATLVPDETTVLWGIVYELKGEQIAPAMASLTTREMKLGGYTTLYLDFHVRHSKAKPFPVIVYAATPDCDLYMGPPESIDQMALQIVTSHGKAGPNSEYVTKLADFTRKYIPEEDDPHLFLLDKKIRTLLAMRNNASVSTELTEKLKSSQTKDDATVNSSDDLEKTTANIFSVQKRVNLVTIENCQTNLLPTKDITDRDE